VLITKHRDDIYFAELELTGPESFASQSAIATITQLVSRSGSRHPSL
jgi:hypothetical protein